MLEKSGKILSLAKQLNEVSVSIEILQSEMPIEISFEGQGASHLRISGQLKDGLMGDFAKELSTLFKKHYKNIAIKLTQEIRNLHIE